MHGAPSRAHDGFSMVQRTAWKMAESNACHVRRAYAARAAAQCARNGATLLSKLPYAPSGASGGAGRCAFGGTRSRSHCRRAWPAPPGHKHRHRYGTVAAQSQRSHSTVAAQSQHSRRAWPEPPGNGTHPRSVGTNQPASSTHRHLVRHSTRHTAHGTRHTAQSQHSHSTVQHSHSTAQHTAHSTQHTAHGTRRAARGGWHTGAEN